MVPSDQISAHNNDEIDLVALWRVIWSRRYIVVSVTSAFCLVAVFLALTATPIYRAEVVVTEVRDGGMSAAASLANQFGGLANLAGVSLGVGGGHEAQAVLGSRRLVEEFIRRHALISELSSDPKKPLSLWRAVNRFQESVLFIREDKRNGTTRVTINWKDPAISAQWANDIVSLANELVRSRALDDSSRNISFLNEQIKKTNIVELQRVMYNLVESETKTQMLANAKAEYAFNVIDPAVPPEIRVSPKRTLMVFVGALVGFFVGIASAFVHHAVRRRALIAANGTD